MEETGMDYGKEGREDEDMDCSEELILNILSPPSLENLALVCIAVRLCGKPDLTKSRSQDHDEIDKIYKNVLTDMLDKLAEIPLPHPLIIKLANVFRPIGLQLRHLMEYNFPDYHSLEHFICETASYYWTMEGSIDKVKSLKEIIKSTKNLGGEENFDYLYSLYGEACRYCLDDCISDLWFKVSDEEHEFDYDDHMRYAGHLVAYWDAVRENKLSSLVGQLKQHDNKNIYDCNLSICENMVALSVFMGNKISFKYFWFKLTHNQKISGLDKWLSLIFKKTNWATRRDYLSGYIDIICVLMSHLNRRKQEEILQIESEQILLSLFHLWPFQRFFLSTISAMFHFLQDDVYTRILSVAWLETRLAADLFAIPKTLWQISPLRLKRAYVQYLTNNGSIIVHLVNFDDVVAIDMLLSCASAAEKKQIIFRLCKEPNLKYVLSRDETVVFVLDKLVSEALSSDLDVLEFKRNVGAEFADFLCFHWLRECDIEATETFLDWIFQSENEILEYKKRNIKPMEIYRSLIHSSEYEPAEHFLHWYFDTEEELLQFKNTFVHGFKCSDCIELLSSFSGEGKVGWDKFEKFLNYGFISSEEMIELKKNAFTTCAEFFVNHRKFEFATLFLQWCLDTPDEINRFKTEVLLSKDVFMWLIKGNPNPNWEEVKNVLKWFAPLSKQLIEELKFLLELDFCEFFHEYEENLSEKGLILFDLLDSFSEERQMP